MNRQNVTSTFAVILITASGSIHAQQQPSEEEELAAAYVSLATGTAQPVIKAPSTATVITARDIQAMGAEDLMQVLEGVPALHVSYSTLAFHPRIFIRGLASEFSPEALILVNGSGTNLPFHNRDSFVYGKKFVENIARIEVIRGPGSALYGADAFSGVINIITKSTQDLSALEVGARYGSFNTKDVWLQSGKKWNGFNTALFIAAGTSDGQKGIISRDFQTPLDALFGTHASLAPGPVNAGYKAYDAQLEVSNENWKMLAGISKREVGTGAGVAENLDPAGILPEKQYSLNIAYNKSNIIPGLDILAKFEYLQLNEYIGNPALKLWPNGAFNNTFPDGLIGNPGHSERRTQLGFTASYSNIQNHKIRIGLGHTIEDLYETRETKNFRFVTTASGVGIAPLGRIVDASNDPDLVYLLPHKRNLSYIFAQDEWIVAKDWALTAGVRHDRYSDFGGTTNPRFALVWDAAYNVVVKFIHGRAFRAPSFSEQYNANSPVANGNPLITPEKIRTNELGFVWTPNQKIQTSLTIFQYRQSNIIAFVPDRGGNGTATAQNTGNQTGRGFELEATWDIGRNLRLSGNLSMQHSIDEASGKNAGLAPRRHLYVRSDWRFIPNWQLGTVINHVGGRSRQPSDLRKPIADYTTVDLSLRKDKAFANWDVTFAARNIFDRDAREPTLSPGNIPDDLPLPGRSLSVQFSSKF